MDEVDERMVAVRPISRGAFFALTFVLGMVLFPLESIAAWCGCWMVGARFPIQGFPVGLAFFNWVVSKVIVDAILRRMGRSFSGSTREVRTRVVGFEASDVADKDSVEVRLPRSTAIIIVCGVVGGCLLGYFVAFVSEDWWAKLGWSLFACLMGVLSLALIWDASSVEYQVRADAAGITGYPSGLHIRRRFVPWSDVLNCEIKTFTNTFGEPVAIVPILKGADGRVLLTVNPNFGSKPDQERLIKYIRTRLPKTKDDWDWS